MANKADYDPHETRRQPRPTRPVNLSRPRIPETHDANTSNLILPAHVRRLIESQQAVDAIETAPLPHRPSPQEIDDLKHQWLMRPMWDIEYTVGFEYAFDELAAWHDAQIELRARALGCTRLMAAALEHLVRAWISVTPPLYDPIAMRILASYR